MNCDRVYMCVCVCRVMEGREKQPRRVRVIFILFRMVGHIKPDTKQYLYKSSSKSCTYRRWTHAGDALRAAINRRRLVDCVPSWLGGLMSKREYSYFAFSWRAARKIELNYASCERKHNCNERRSEILHN